MAARQRGSTLIQTLAVSEITHYSLYTTKMADGRLETQYNITYLSQKCMSVIITDGPPADVDVARFNYVFSSYSELTI